MAIEDSYILTMKARLDVLENLVCWALAEADIDLAKRLEDAFRGIGEHGFTHLPDEARMSSGAGILLADQLAMAISDQQHIAGRKPPSPRPDQD